MATTIDDVDYLGRPLYNTDTDAIDYMGRAVTASTDFLGRDLQDIEEEEETFLLADDFTGTNGDPWDETLWPVQRVGDTPTGGTWTQIQSNAGRIVGGAGGRIMVFSAIDVTDFELLVKRTGPDHGDFPEIGWRVGAAIASGDPGNGYLISGDTTGGGVINMFRIGAYTNIGSAAAVALNAAVTAWFRIQAIGTAHKVRWWLDGDAEPGTWQIEVTDATYTTGRIMFAKWGGSDNITYDDLTVTEL